MKAQLIHDMTGLDREHRDANRRMTLKAIPAQTVIDHPDAFRLVRQGVAIPADEECQKAAAMTAQQMALAQAAQRKVNAGIHPEDYEAFEAGMMIGYHPDGTWILGPAADQDAEDCPDTEIEEEVLSDD